MFALASVFIEASENTLAYYEICLFFVNYESVMFYCEKALAYPVCLRADCYNAKFSALS